jgi:hypothetical protein
LVGEINDGVTAGTGVLQDCTEELINWRRDMSPTVREISKGHEPHSKGDLQGT